MAGGGNAFWHRAMAEGNEQTTARESRAGTKAERRLAANPFPLAARGGSGKMPRRQQMKI